MPCQSQKSPRPLRLALHAVAPPGFPLLWCYSIESSSTCDPFPCAFCSKCTQAGIWNPGTSCTPTLSRASLKFSTAADNEKKKIKCFQNLISASCCHQRKKKWTRCLRSTAWRDQYHIHRPRHYCTLLIKQVRYIRWSVVLLCMRKSSQTCSQKAREVGKVPPGAPRPLL